MLFVVIPVPLVRRSLAAKMLCIQIVGRLVRYTKGGKVCCVLYMQHITRCYAHKDVICKCKHVGNILLEDTKKEKMCHHNPA